MKIKGNNFVFFDNDFDHVVFKDYHIDYYSDKDDLEYSYVDDEPELEWLLEDPPDIYSDNHPWDTLHNKKYRFRPDIWMLNIDYTN